MEILLYTKLNEAIHEVLLSKLSELPESFANKITRFKRWQDVQASLLGRILLIKGLRELQLQNYSLYDIKYTEFNRPYLDENLDFNIAHSGEYVICMVSNEMKVGIDIEQHNPINFTDFYNIFNEEELLELCNSNDKLGTFYRFWTIKEAILKAEGIGLNYSLDNLYIKNNICILGKKKWFLKVLSLIDSYSIAIASSQHLNANLNIRLLDSEDILDNHLLKARIIPC